VAAASLRRAPEKLKYLAGTESGAGAFMNDVPPERAAAMLAESDVCWKRTKVPGSA